ncbi:MAG: MlaD family protein [Kiritimatiellia bacterium]
MAVAKSEYIKVGAFVLAAVALGTIAVIVLGSSAFDKSEVLMETYMEESVQGLDVGGAVKFRGIPIGRIHDITFVCPTYSAPDTPEGRRSMRYARIVFSVDSRFVDETSGDISFGGFVQDRLRISKKNQGVTGMMYLNIDYVSSPDTATLPVPWTPEHFYMPSERGLTQAISDIIQNISDQLSKMDLEHTISMVNEIFSTVTNEITQARIGDTGNKINSVVTRLDTITANVEAMVRSEDLAGVPATAAEALKSLAAVTRELEASLPGLLKTAGAATGEINAVASESRASVLESLENIRRATDTLNELLERLKDRPSLILRDSSDE